MEWHDSKWYLKDEVLGASFMLWAILSQIGISGGIVGYRSVNQYGNANAML